MALSSDQARNVSLQFAHLFMHSPNAYMVLDRELRFIEVNHAYELLTGASREQLLGRGLFEVFPGGSNADGSSETDVLRQSLEDTFATGERGVLALIPYSIASGTDTGQALDIRYWSATHTPIRDDSGELVAVMQHTADVTELHQLRQQVHRAPEAIGSTDEQLSGGVLSRAAAVQQNNLRLSARQAFLTDLFTQAPGFMAVLRGPDHVFELANEAYEQLVGRKDFLGAPVREALPEVAGQGFLELLDGVRTSGRPFVGRAMPIVLRGPDGANRAMHVDFIFQPIHHASGAIEGIFVQGSDVSDRETALAALRENEARFRTIANLLPQMIWSTRADGHHDYFNQRWYDFTGVPEGSTDGAGWSGMFHPGDRDQAWAQWHHSIATGEPYEIEYRLRDRHGQYRWVLGRALPVRDDQGSIVRWMGTCTDIHEHKQVQQRLERSEQALRMADRQKDHFLATLAHELRNPLAPIANAAQLLRMAPAGADALGAAEIIDRQAEHMRRLIDDLMDVSRVTRGLAKLQKQPVWLAAVIAAAVEQATPVISRRGHRLDVVDRAPDLRLQADAMRLTQVLANLLHNAAKFTPPGGLIVIEAEHCDDFAVVRVRDNGMGMEPALLERVFELFTQADTTPERREGGLGIGLALARSLAELHGGTLVATSAGPGCGSTFELRLPLGSPVAEPTGESY